MFSIASIVCSVPTHDGAHLWRRVVLALSAWLTEIRVLPREAVILLPQIWHLQLARNAWSDEVGGWLPQFETPQTLARGWGPDAPALPGMITFDVALDRLTARGMLQRLFDAVGTDERGQDHALNALVQTAHGMARAAAMVPPGLREAHWQRCREALEGDAVGPAGRERAIASLALGWAAFQPAPSSDVLFDPPVQVGAWAMVQAGGADPLAQAVLSHACLRSPCGVLNLDAEAEAELGSLLPNGPQASLRVAVCDDFEDEAQRCAAVILRHVAVGETPVCLVAQDRVLVRRVQALLSRQRVPLQDETGWKLSTTPAAASVMAWLRWFSPAASLDELLDAIKTIPQRQAEASVLESNLRRASWRRVSEVSVDALSPAAHRLWNQVLTARTEMSTIASQPLSRWVVLLGRVLRSLGLLDSLESDAAGIRLLAALRLTREVSGWAELSQGAGPLAWELFVQWVEQTLEQMPFVPEAHPEALVVVAPLSHALLRPFAVVVFPGADSRHCSAPSDLHPLLTMAQAQVFGLPTAESEQASLWLALWQLMRVPKVTMMHRLFDEQEPLLPSALLERLRLVWCRHRPSGGGDLTLPEARVERWLEATPVKPGSPSAPQLLPARMSASACEALRTCPYRFFALRMLGLQTVDELEKAPGKRDYGTWLHEVLLKFHTAREMPQGRDEAAQLRRIARESQLAMGWDDAEFLPYMVSFEGLVERYLRWLHQRDAQGAQWVAGELKISAAPEAWKGVTMSGVIDRLDEVQTPDGTVVTELIDYKTGSSQGLNQRVRDTMEETQLAFYAALLLARHGEQSIRAGYLPLDEKEGQIKILPHDDVNEGAQWLVEGIGMDLDRLRQGASLLPLGRGSACEYCEARGLCRRDHWAAPCESVGGAI